MDADAEYFIGREVFTRQGYGVITWCYECGTFAIDFCDIEWDIGDDHVWYDHAEAANTASKLRARKGMKWDVFVLRHKENDWGCAIEIKKPPMWVNRLGYLPILVPA